MGTLEICGFRPEFKVRASSFGSTGEIPSPVHSRPFVASGRFDMSGVSSLRFLGASAVRNRVPHTDRLDVLWGSCLSKSPSGRPGVTYGGSGSSLEAVGMSGGCKSSSFSANASGRRLLCSTASFLGSLIYNVLFSAFNCTKYLPGGYGCNFSNIVTIQKVTASADFELKKRSVTPKEKINVKALNKSSVVSASLIHPPSPTTDSRIIHSTAIVHPDAIIGEGVEIGAFCTVGQKVKLGNGCILHPGSHIFGNTQLGENCVLLTGAVVGADIPGKTIIGDHNLIGYHAVVGVKCQDMKYKEGDECHLYIGNNNDIREFASIHRSSKPDDNTILGNDNLIMGSCHIAHDCKVGNRNILANGTLLGGHVVLEDLVHTGGAVAVHQFCHIGSYSFLAGGSMVDRDIPMFMMVAGDRAELRGLNLEGMRRCGFSDLEVRSIRKAYQKLFMSSDDSGGVEDRLSELEQTDEFLAVPAVGMMLQSVRNCFGEARRGICRFRHWSSV
ncbi:hypothetical protein Mapa_005573 [Marchantia paleacea]|nr:hypothetical protein Mapa_005573 [Marchantia paleacea]